MDFYEVVNKRRSIRAYQDKAIPTDSLTRIGKAVQVAPSACNRQPWKFLVVQNDAMRADICACYSGPWLAQAPAIIVALADFDTCWKRSEGTPIADIDLGIAMEHVVLAAAAEGLGTCWICAYEIARLNQALKIQEPWSALAISPLGYPKETPGEKPRKPLDEIFQVVR